MRELAFAVACGLAVGLLVTSAPWHVKSRNSGTLLYIGWALVGNLIFLVNTVVWNGNISNPAPIWCDIATKLIIGLNVAMPCVSLCIQRRLYHISRISQVSPTHEQRRREIYVDLSIGLGFPVLIMILHYIVQGHRYDIYEDYGCWPNVYLSWPAFVLVLPWPIVISSVSLVYAGLTVRNFLRRRATFNELLKSQATGLNVNRYVRLMALASIEMLFVFPMSIVVLVHNANLKISPWISWENTHYNFGRVSFITQFLFKSSGNSTVIFELTRWCMPVAGFLFFIFFGLASEARKQYKKAFESVAQTLGIRPSVLPYSDRKDTPYVSS
ncbi:hypothetical protein M408DRAFT_72477 [Serendipita vermifera MAFF 305830]|uniref:Fungal pheromone STE3G-protein-coupled receptor n=1 Tax=Serendipita vermifera MAFF 305830 TaxID=933852 RepID=A0A0C3APN9_SERVB|nr:hypothetical protein M408DRAFT_72477 [Serendipita vermifera MAFF 305830]